MRGFIRRILKLSIESIFGNIVWIACSAIVPWALSWATGSIPIIQAFALQHIMEFIGWSASFLIFGLVAGLLIRHQIAIRATKKLELSVEEKESDLAGLRKELSSARREIDSLKGKIKKLPTDEVLYMKNGEINRLEHELEYSKSQYQLVTSQGYKLRETARNLSPIAQAYLHVSLLADGSFCIPGGDGSLELLEKEGLLTRLQTAHVLNHQTVRCWMVPAQVRSAFSDNKEGILDELEENFSRDPNYRRLLSAVQTVKESELEKLGKDNRTAIALFQEFTQLTVWDQRSVVAVWLSEPEGQTPTNGQRRQMDELTRMSDFLRLDPVADKLHIKDNGVNQMLLENPEHVYPLAVAQVASLQTQLEDYRTAGRSTDEAADKVASSDGSSKAVRTISGSLVRSIDALEAFSPDMAAAAIESYEMNGDVPLDEYDKTVRESVGRRDGVFSISEPALTWRRLGEDPSAYRLTDPWRSFLDDAKVLRILRKRAEHSSIRITGIAKQVVHQKIVPISNEEITEIWNKAISGDND